MGRAGGGGFSGGGGGHRSGGFSGGGGGHRSGGFSGGGSRSGGSSFGGGRSGGSRPSGGYSSRPSGGYSSRPSGGFSSRPSGGYSSRPSGGPRPGAGPRPSGGPRPGGGYRGPVYTGGGGRVGRRGGCGTALWILVALLIIFALIGAFSGSGSSSNSSQSASSESITYSTVNREKLKSSDLVQNGYYTDEAGYIYNSSKLEKGMKEFYNETGVSPYLYLTDNIDGNTMPDSTALADFAEEKYQELFSDEAHFLLVMVDSTDLEDAGDDFVATYVVGSEALTVMDEEACQILGDYVTSYYYSSSYADWEDFLSAAFSDSADRIMTVTTTKEDVAKTRAVVLGVVAVGACVILLVNRKYKRDKEKAEEDQRILNTPLGDLTEDDLVNKYTSDEDSEEDTTYTEYTSYGSTYDTADEAEGVRKEGY